METPLRQNCRLIACLSVLSWIPTALAAEQGITVEGQKVTVRTATVEAVFDGPAVVSLTGADGKVQFVGPEPPANGLDLFYLNGNTLGRDKHQAVVARKISPMAARITVDGDDSHRSLLVVIDPDMNDIRVTPNGLSNRRGVRSVGWGVPFVPQATVILPVVNGLKFQSDKPWPGNGRFLWPFQWCAQLAVAERDGSSLMVHCEDTQMRFKAIRVTRNGPKTELCFESEPTGPLWENRTAGGLEWRINVYKGDWKVPATRYREWLNRTYNLAEKRKHRPAWVDKISLAVCWADAGSEAFLDALAAIYPPEETLIHLSGNWRTDKYDVNYPDFAPNEAGLKYIAKARKMGFHVMPHFNYFAVWMKHPFFQQVRDFQIRSVDQNSPEGWYWPPETYDYTRMAYIHPGLGLWREKLIDVLLGTCGQMETDTAFIDQTLCTWNTDNGTVEGMNTIEGMRQLQEEFLAVQPGLVLAGEGLNEISFQRECFAQAHIHDGWGSLEPKHPEGVHPICSFLWAGHTRLLGYFHLTPTNKDFDLGVEVYERMGVMPTIVSGDPKHLQEMSPGTKKIFDRARRERDERDGKKKG
jgi:hypothetical protein